MILKAYIENYGSQAFDLVDGSVIKTNLNETLDSGAINITNITTKLELFPFQFVKLVSTDNTFSKYFIIDNFVETIENLDENIYDYVINLASPLKILEKVQLPNRTVIHSLSGLRQTLYQVINEMMTLYCPKVKKTNDNETWNYEYIFSWQQLSNDQKLLDTYCPDLSFNAPTLREVITTLMLVVGYLPTVNHRTLTFIDLRANATNFNIQENRIYSVKRSNSVDSYVNTLQVQADNVLDTNNKVINEMIGFRDRDNVFLKHTENLKLETRFPIESIEKLELSTFAKLSLGGKTKSDFVLGDLFSLQSPSTQTDFDENSRVMISTTDDSYNLNNVSAYFYYAPNTSIAYKSGESLITFNAQPQLVQTRNYGNVRITPLSGLLIEPTSAVDYTYIVIKYTYLGSTQYLASFSLVNSYSLIFYTYFSYDLTSIVFEEGKRKLLSKDYNLIQQDIDFDDFPNFYYTTLSYRYGGREITGFSNTWKEFTWFGALDENFMETLIRTIVPDASEYFDDYNSKLFLTSDYINVGTVSYTPQEIFGSENEMSQYALYTFNLEYRPFNNINVRYTKGIDNLPFAIEQLDKQEASIPMLDEFSYREQEKVNRLGNNVLQIHQSQASDLSYINDLNTLYQDSVVFSREIAFYDDGFEVNYVASKDYVLKNYFTALQTKYRAYEYVDYNQTVLRKENKKVFVYIGNYIFNGDDHIYYGALNTPNDDTPSFLWSALLPYEIGNNQTFKYQVDGISKTIGTLWYYERYKNDLSVITYKDNIIFSSIMFDSVSVGICIEDPVETTPQGGYLGGYIQGWYMNNYYAEAQKCMFTTKTIGELTALDPYFVPANDTNDIVNLIFDLPKIHDLPLSLQSDYLQVVDNKNSSVNRERNAIAYHKSQNEILSQTLQFEYYTDKQESGKPFYEWTEKFVELNSAVFDRSKGEMQLYGYAEPTELLDYDYQAIPLATQLTPYSNYVLNIVGGVSFSFTSLFTYSFLKYVPTYRTIKIVWYDSESGIYHDVFAFQFESEISDEDFFNNYNAGNIHLYFSMNDTKTNKVYKVNETSGLWEQSKEIQVNTTSRILK